MDNKLDDALKTIRILRLSMARHNFLEFCYILSPGYYKTEHKHLTELCNILDDLYKNKLLKKKLNPDDSVKQ